MGDVEDHILSLYTHPGNSAVSIISLAPKFEFEPLESFT